MESGGGGGLRRPTSTSRGSSADGARATPTFNTLAHATAAPAVAAHDMAGSSAAVPTCIWMSFSASHRISSAVHDIGTARDVLQIIYVCMLSSFSSPYMSFLCCNALGRDRSILRLRA